MSDLRNHLQSLRAAHRRSRYTGDLAVDVGAVPRPRTSRGGRRWLVGSIAAGGAIAAMLAIAVVARRADLAERELRGRAEVIRPPIARPPSTIAPVPPGPPVPMTPRVPTMSAPRLTFSVPPMDLTAP